MPATFLEDEPTKGGVTFLDEEPQAEIKEAPTIAGELRKGQFGSAGLLLADRLHSVLSPTQPTSALQVHGESGGSLLGSREKPFPYSPDESVVTRIPKAVGNVVNELMAGATSPEGITGIFNPAQIPDMAGQQFSRIKQSEATPAGSPERLEAGLSTVALLGLPAVHAGYRSLRERLAPVLGEDQVAGEPSDNLPLPTARAIDAAIVEPAVQLLREEPKPNEQIPVQENQGAAPLRDSGTANGASEITTTGDVAQSNVADALRPALRTEEGVIASERGQVHDDIYAAQSDPVALRASDPEHGFVDAAGNFKTRAEAAALVGETEPLQSERLRELQTAAEPETATGISRAAIEEQQDSRSLPAIERQKQIDFGSSLQRANELISKDSDLPRKLVDELAANPRALSPEETPIIIRRVQEVQNDFDSALRAVNEAPDEVTRAAAQDRLNQARDEYDKAIGAAQGATSKTGAGLNSLKMLVKEDYSLARIENRARAANNGNALPIEETVKFQELSNRLQEVSGQLEERERQLAEMEFQDDFRKALKEVVPKAKEAAKSGRGVVDFLDEQAAQARERIKARRGRLNVTIDPLNIAGLADEVIIGASHIARGLRTLAEWSAEMVKEFGEGIQPKLAELFKQSKDYHDIGAGAFDSKQDTNLKRYKTLLRNKIGQVSDRLASGNLDTHARTKTQLDTEATNLRFQYQKVKQEIDRRIFEVQLSKRTGPQKVFGTAREVLNTSRAVLTSLDLSAVLRQGGFISIGHPIRGIKAFPDMFRALRSEAGQFKANEEIRNRPNAELYAASKLYLHDERAVKLSQMEEAYMGRWIGKIPLVAGSERAYTTFLNRLRADSFDTMAATLSRDGRPSIQEAKAISNFVNVATGRGNLDGAARAATNLNTVFFAPRYVVSRFQLLGGQPLIGGTLGTRKLIAGEYARTVGGLGLVYGLGILAGGTVEVDPRSSDFGKIKFGNTRVDPLFGVSQSAVLLSRLASGSRKNAEGDIIPIRGENVPFGSSNSADVIATFLRSKLSPPVGAAVDLAAGKDVTGNPVSLQSEALRNVTPLALSDIKSAMEDQGIERGTALSLLSIFGAGLQTYNSAGKTAKRGDR